MAYNRYSNNQIITNTNGKQYLSTSYMSIIEPNINDIYIITKQGDRLDLLAHQYYNDITMWVFIARANFINNGSMSLVPGQQIRIPSTISQIQTNDITINR